MTLSTTAVTWQYDSTPVVRNVSINIVPGRVTVLLGPNGAGKSTLLRLLAGDLLPYSGEVTINGSVLQEITLQAQAQLRSVMMQSVHVVFDFFVEDILEMGWVYAASRAWGRPDDALKRAALESVMIECNIADFKGRKFNALSGGEQQRVQFARALLQLWRPENNTQPCYLLLDEPTSSLDLAHSIDVLNLARKAAKKGAGVFIIVHDVNLAARFADEIILLEAGRVVSKGTVEHVLTSETLSRVYNTPISVEYHPALERLVVFN